MNEGDKAVQLFSNGYNCAQATAAAFAEKAKIHETTICTMMAGFGGGIGGSRELCGAVTGMIWALGLYHGGYDPTDNDAKTRMYQMIKTALEEFKTQFGTTCCRELLLKADCLPNPDPSVRNAEYYAKRPCAHFVKKAADIAARRGETSLTAE